MTSPSSKLSAWARHVMHLRAARTFIEACESEGIPVLPVKGIVTAYTLYDDPADRPLTDVDVRVVPRHIPRVAHVCRKRGWPIVQRMRAYSNLVAVVEGVNVDVEAHVGPPGMCNLHISGMLDRAASTEALGFFSRVPDFTDHAVLLLVNAFKDKLVGAFDWAIRDLDRIPERAPFDARALANRLRQCAATTIGWIAADWMVRARGRERWGQVRDELGAPRRTRYVRAFRSWLERDPDAFVTRILARGAADAAPMRVRALAHMALWQAEVVASKLGPAPYVRGNVPVEVRAKIEPSHD